MPLAKTAAKANALHLVHGISGSGSPGRRRRRLDSDHARLVEHLAGVDAAHEHVFLGHVIDRELVPRPRELLANSTL